MRWRITLFELLGLIIPAIAVLLGLLTAAAGTSHPGHVLTIAQSLYLLVALAAVCLLYHQRAAVRVFAGAFLLSSLGHLLLVWLANQSLYGDSFPTTALLKAIWYQTPAAAAASNAGYGDPTWFSYPTMVGGYTGGMPGPPMTGMVTVVNTPAFVDVGIWGISLLIGMLCGIAARAVRGPDPPH